MDTLFLTRSMSRGDGPVSELPMGAQMELSADIQKWIEHRRLTSLVVLKDGALVAEGYFQETTPEDRRMSWSVAKSFQSALLGVIIAEGAISSLDDQVTKYAPQLIGSAYDGATLRNVLHMASGVEFNEDYIDFWSDINKMGRVLALGGSMDGFAAGLEVRAREPGEAWDYVSIDTHVIGMVIRGATGRSVAELLAEKILQPLGLEADPYYVTDGYNVAFVLGGLNLRTRDYARFGQMMLQDGFWNGKQIVPSDWIAQSTAPSAPPLGANSHYGFQWWIPVGGPGGEYYAIGVYGQYIYINTEKNVVVAINSADIHFTEDGTLDENLTAFRAIANAL